MAILRARMTTNLLDFATCLLTGFQSILTLSWSMTLFLASMCAAFQLASTYLTASNFGEPAWLVLQSVFTTQTWFGSQERALRAVLVVLMTVVGNLRMATILGPLTLGTAWRRFGAAWQWRVDNSPAAIAANLVEYGLPTCPTGTFVAEFLASMVGIPTL